MALGTHAPLKEGMSVNTVHCVHSGLMIIIKSVRSVIIYYYYYRQLLSELLVRVTVGSSRQETADVDRR